MQKQLPSFNSNLGYYKMKNSINDMTEYGYKLSNDDIVNVVKILFDRILKTNITLANAYATVSGLEYKLVYDTISDTYTNEDGWITLSSVNDIENISFKVEDFYIEHDADTSAKIREDFETKIKEIKAKSNKKKATKKSTKKVVAESKKA